MSRRIPFGAPIATAAEMRAAEDRVIAGGVSVTGLMERAGLAIAREVRRLAVGRPILIAAGPGNNGGDAYVAARHLAGWGLDVEVATIAAPRGEAAVGAARGWAGPTSVLGEGGRRPVLVDGLLGTGTSRPLAPDLSARFAAQQERVELTIAIDLPSGVAADADGRADAGGSSARADVTLALGALKPGHLVGAGAAACGHLLLADIGVPVATDATTIAPPILTRLPEDAQKFTRGMVAVVGGAMPGASLLAATSAMHGGAGYVVLAERAAAGETPHALVRRIAPDARALKALLDDDRIGAVVVGPGLGRDAAARAVLDTALASGRDLVVDADALSLLPPGAPGIGQGRRLFLTPHGGEFDKLFGAGGGNKIDRTRAAAAASGAFVVHKGAATVIASPGGRVVVAAGTTPWLSTAGTGDVLAGLLGARHARDRDRPLPAASEAVWLHGAAGALAGTAFVADDVVRHLPAALAAATWR